MSVAAMTSIWRYSQADGLGLLILLALGDWADDEGYCFPSHRAIAEKSRTSRSSVKRAIQDHLATGELESVAVKGHNAPTPREFIGRTGFRPTTLYRITLVDKLGSRRTELPERTGSNKNPVISTNWVQPETLTGSKQTTQLGPNTRSHIRNKPSEYTSEDTSGEKALALDPLEAFRLAWNELTTEPICRCHSLTANRRRLIQACMVERPLDAWRALFARIEQSSFLHRNELGWVSLDWIIASPDPALKVLEGRYDDRARHAAVQCSSSTAFEWNCGHTPHCLNRRSCRMLVDLEQAKKGA